MSKVYYIVNDNMVLDTIVERDSNTRQVAETTLDYIKKSRDTEWLEPYILELEADGDFIEGTLNVVTTIKLNNKPVKSIVNQVSKLPLVIEQYQDDEYRKYTFSTEWFDGGRQIL